MIEATTLIEVREILINSESVSDIEFTSGNYDKNGVLVKEKIPSISTEIAEIIRDNDYCYFTVICYSEKFDKKVLKSIKEHPTVSIYGLKNFLETYYPTDHFNLDEFFQKVKSEEYVQVQFGYPVDLIPEEIVKAYMEIKELFPKDIVVNQLIKSL